MNPYNDQQLCDDSSSVDMRSRVTYTYATTAPCDFIHWSVGGALRDTRADAGLP